MDRFVKVTSVIALEELPDLGEMLVPVMLLLTMLELVHKLAGVWKTG